MKIKVKNKKILPVFIACFVVVFFGISQALKIFSVEETDSVNLSVTVEQVIAMDCGSDVDLGSLTPGTPVAGSSTCTITTNAESGYDLQVKRDDADTTMDKVGEATINIADKTAWDGSSNAVVYSGTGLGFSVYASTANKNDTWWGSGIAYNDTNNKYAGFPGNYVTIMDYDSYSSVSTTTSVSYKLDVPATQKSGAYDGSITFQAVGKP